MSSFARIPAILLCACCVQAWCQEAPEVDDAIFAFIHDHQRRVHPAAAGDGFTAINPDIGLWASIDAHGFALAPTGTTDWRTHLRIDGLGRTAGPWLPWEPGAPSAVERELTWAGRHMDVQYVNGDDGLRQNFIVHERPAGHGPMRVGLTWASDLHGAPLDDGTGAVFTDLHGEPRHVYKDLHVFDACGRVLAAWMEVDPGTRTINLHVDDHLAEYPVTVDPISTTYNLQINLNHVGLGIGTPGTEFGYAVCSAGDLNGDGYGDIAIGAFEATLTLFEEGVVYVFYGSPAGITIAGHTVLPSGRAQANFGVSVAHGGDVNGDGYSDLVIGGNTYASHGSHYNEGAVWVFFGSPTGVDPAGFQRFESDRPNTMLGFDVAGLGDINGDGYSDFVGGCSLYGNGHANEGAAYVFMGSADIATDGFTPVHILEPDWVTARFGSSVAGAGDINGDGYDDMVVGAYGYDLTTPNSAEGAIMVYYGSPTVVAGVARPFGTAPTVVNPAPGQLFNAHVETGNYRTGWAVAGAGDVNGDGYSD
ncbi:MAG: integrin alpha, partial [Flavobacteriales bacterium]|nr:integrin alpha [Flavobacteriales bacterium]